MTNFNGQEVDLPEDALLIKSARAYDFVSYRGWTIYTLENGGFIIEEDTTGNMVGRFHTIENAIQRIQSENDGR